MSLCITTCTSGQRAVNITLPCEQSLVKVDNRNSSDLCRDKLPKTWDVDDPEWEKWAQYYEFDDDQNGDTKHLQQEESGDVPEAVPPRIITLKKSTNTKPTYLYKSPLSRLSGVQQIKSLKRSCEVVTDELTNSSDEASSELNESDDEEKEPRYNRLKNERNEWKLLWEKETLRWKEDSEVEREEVKLMANMTPSHGCEPKTANLEFLQKRAFQARVLNDWSEPYPKRARTKTRWERGPKTETQECDQTNTSASVNPGFLQESVALLGEATTTSKPKPVRVTPPINFSSSPKRQAENVTTPVSLMKIVPPSWLTKPIYGRLF